MMTMLDVSTLLGVDWDVVNDIFKRDFKYRFGKPNLSKLKYIAIVVAGIRIAKTGYMMLMEADNTILSTLLTKILFINRLIRLMPPG